MYPVDERIGFFDQKSVLDDVESVRVPAFQSDFRVGVKVGVGDTDSGYPGDVALLFVSRQMRLFLNGNKIHVRRGVESINIFD